MLYACVWPRRLANSRLSLRLCHSPRIQPIWSISPKAESSETIRYSAPSQSSLIKSTSSIPKSVTCVQNCSTVSDGTSIPKSRYRGSSDSQTSGTYRQHDCSRPGTIEVHMKRHFIDDSSGVRISETPDESSGEHVRDERERIALELKGCLFPKQYEKYLVC